MSLVVAQSIADLLAHYIPEGFTLYCLADNRTETFLTPAMNAWRCTLQSTESFHTGHGDSPEAAIGAALIADPVPRVYLPSSQPASDLLSLVRRNSVLLKVKL